MSRPYLDDGCKCCGSQEWTDDLTDVDHDADCPVTVLRSLVDKWRSDYHCCVRSKHRTGGHDNDCPLASAITYLGV